MGLGFGGCSVVALEAFEVFQDQLVAVEKDLQSHHSGPRGGPHGLQTVSSKRGRLGLGDRLGKVIDAGRVDVDQQTGQSALQLAPGR